MFLQENRESVFLPTNFKLKQFACTEFDFYIGQPVRLNHVIFLDRLPRNRAHGCLILSLAEIGEKRAGAGGCNRQCSNRVAEHRSIIHAVNRFHWSQKRARHSSSLVLAKIESYLCKSMRAIAFRAVALLAGAIPCGRNKDRGRILSLERENNWPNFYSSFLRKIYWNPTAVKWLLIRMIK